MYIVVLGYCDWSWFCGVSLGGHLEDNCIQNFHLGGISSDLLSEIKFYGDARIN